QVLGLVLKVPLSIWLTFGGAGLPALGVEGCAWATLLVQAAMLATALWLARTQALYRPLRLWQRLERPDGRQLRHFARLGVPAGLAILVEVTSFTLMALFIARQGTTAAGAHQIAANLAAVLYMVPLSLAIATSARVSFWRGAGDEARARLAALTGFKAVGLMAIALAALLFIAKDAVVTLYSGHAAVVAVGAPLVAWVALYHLVDAVQCFCIFVLRCYRITIAPLVVYSLLLWGAGLGGGYVLAYHGWGPWPAQPTPAVFWITSAAALAVTALAFVAMLRRCLARADGAAENLNENRR
ncbi:MAG: MATE family efflux transporter, partial [Giesbergeria sp.]|nr:MATE family efflux transporter [Giesbergeria sp.]